MSALNTFAQSSYYYTTTTTDYSLSPGNMLLSLVILVLIIAGLWRIFDKAKQPGWAAIVPIYNIVILLKVVNRPLWWIILYLIPFVNIIIHIVVAYDLAKSFKKGVGMTLVLIFFPYIGYPILGFGSAQYKMIKHE